MRRSVIKLPEDIDLTAQDILPQDKVMHVLLERCENATIKSIERGEDVEEEKYYQAFDQILSYIEKKNISPTEMLYRHNGDGRTLKDRLSSTLYYFYDDPEAMTGRIEKWHRSENRMIQEVVYAMLLKLKHNRHEIPPVELPDRVLTSLNNYHEEATTGD